MGYAEEFFEELCAAYGRTDLFDLLIDLRDALQADDGAAVALLLPNLDAGEEQVLAEEVAGGALSQRLTEISRRLERILSRRPRAWHRLFHKADREALKK